MGHRGGDPHSRRHYSEDAALVQLATQYREEAEEESRRLLEEQGEVRPDGSKVIPADLPQTQ